jgi:hypothetical protein
MSSDFRSSNTFKVGAVLLFIVALCVLATQLLRGSRGSDEQKGFVAEKPNAAAQPGGGPAEPNKPTPPPSDSAGGNTPPPKEGEQVQAPPPRIPSRPGTSVGAIPKKKPAP